MINKTAHLQSGFTHSRRKKLLRIQAKINEAGINYLNESTCQVLSSYSVNCGRTPQFEPSAHRGHDGVVNLLKWFSNN
jgi:hypothetical protein